MTCLLQPAADHLLPCPLAVLYAADLLSCMLQAADCADQHCMQQQLFPVLLLTDPVLAGERDVVGGATTALTFTAVLETLPARTLPANSKQQTHELVVQQQQTPKQ
jgi:hypothetical protein